ncbi:MAG: PQQ-binding-like beta-propeller repeat protein [Herpetosiphonaceae bacterium]|nr:PQQ-binding-like beta-propeller repeat protein [Herpetosiphonaceae bacterium]
MEHVPDAVEGVLHVPVGLRLRRVWPVLLLVIISAVAWWWWSNRTTTNRQWDGSLALAPAQANVAWPQFGRDATHTGVLSTGTSLVGEVVWQHKTAAPLIASPVVGDGVVYFGSSDSYLYAVDAASGQTRWRYSLGPKLVNSTPVLAGGLLLVAGDYTWINAIDARSGQRVWRYDTGDDVLAPPAVDAEARLALVASGGTLVALNVRNGERQWQVQVTDTTPPGWPSVAAPTVGGGTVFWAPGVGHRLFAFTEASGTTRWSFDAGDRLASTPVLAGDSLYVVTWRGKVWALNSQNGIVRWQRTIGTGQPGEGSEATPSLGGTRLFVGSYQGTLYALDASTGTDLWHFQAAGPFLASPATSNSVVYCASEDGKLYALDAEKGTVRWQHHLAEMRSSPALTDRALYIGTLDGTFVALR